MYIIVAGIGQVGLQIVETLLEEGHSVVVIENDPDRMKEVDSLDLLSISGNAASLKTLIEAGINNADLFIAATGCDEINIVSSVIAKKKGCRTMARVNSLDYMTENKTACKLELFGIDLAICPDQVTANHMAKMLLLPSLVESEVVSKEGGLIINFVLPEKSPLTSINVEGITLPKGCLVSAISRSGAVVSPELAGKFRDGDKIFVTVDSKEKIVDVEKAFRLEIDISTVVGSKMETGMDKIMILGANDIGINLARNLETSRLVLLMDEDEERCLEASKHLHKALVIRTSGIDDDALKEEGIEDVGAFVATTDSSEFNMLACILAKKLGVRKTMALVEDPDLISLFEQIGITVALSPRMITANSMLKHIAKPGERPNTKQIATLPANDSRVIEVFVTKSLWIVGKEFGKIKLPSNSFIGSVIRGGGVMKPTQFDIVRAGDRLIIFTGVESLKKIDKLFMRSRK